MNIRDEVKNVLLDYSYFHLSDKKVDEIVSTVRLVYGSDPTRNQVRQIVEMTNVKYIC